jgi:hypothetical protein
MSETDNETEMRRRARTIRASGGLVVVLGMIVIFDSRRRGR